MDNYSQTNNGNFQQSSDFIGAGSPDFSAYNGNNGQQNNLYNFPHKGIFQPNSNTLICKTNCCCNCIGLYIILYGAFFLMVFIPIGIINNMIVMTIVGSSIFAITLVVGIFIFYYKTVEVKFIFSYPMIEIITKSMLKTNSMNVHKSEIANIIFEYNQTNSGTYQQLHILFKNGNQNNYFGFTTNPPCFTKYEIDYFNNEMNKFFNK